MLRVIVRETDYGCAANIGGPVFNSIKAFDIDVPELEAYLREFPKQNYYVNREVLGIEKIEEK